MKSRIEQEGQRHLVLGTHADNMLDMATKSRGTGLLNPDAVRNIRKQLEHKSQAEIAKVYGVSYGAIGRLARGETWKHVM